ncbi:hypothetical protein [Agromyces lapidis]|uniref:DNA primase n=1 Tax=Agromyces lapidis TaxID=279574 RepID=A0ABV5ST74_9MICO|nr:hypothetical protein [Agromyces lapidis]
MDELAGAGAEIAPDDEDFTVSQDTEFDEADEAHDDDERSLDDVLDEEVAGLDAERRVDLDDERAISSGDAE